MITTIDHSVRYRLDLHPATYMVCHACAQLQPLMKGTGIAFLSESLGMSAASVSQSMKTLIEKGLVEKRENGYYYPSIKWYLAHEGQQVDVNTSVDDLANEVIEAFNSINETKYQLLNNAELVKKIVKHNPKITFNHFKSVIVHKKETWSTDEKMKEYNRPSTIFSSKFLKYLDDATQYWHNKHKHDTATTVIGY